MDDKKTIDTYFVFNLITLQEENFKQLESFIQYFNKTFLNLRDYSWTDFIETVSSELKIPNNKGVITHKYYVKNEYKQLISRYKSLLKELMANGLIFPLYRIICLEESRNNFLEIYRYLLSHYENRETIIKNLYRILQLNILNFEYNSDADLDGMYKIYLRGSADDYSVNGICSDGKKMWLGQKEKSFFPVALKDANYIISYRKNTLSFDKVDMIVKNLEFDSETLPDYKELYDKSVAPFIDYDEVGRNTMLLQVRKDAGVILEDIEKLIEKMKAYKENYQEEFLMDSDIASIDRQIRDYEEPSLYWKVLSEEIYYKSKDSNSHKKRIKEKGE